MDPRQLRALDHPILINKKEVLPMDLITRKTKKPGVKLLQLENKVPVWSLCTSTRTFVMMENVPVATWAYCDVYSNNFRYSHKKF